ncbi:MAG: CRISPR-associated endonuclease Cas2 [Muribaculaceae bacterium]|nr:CRISPR-associated endonuclease Cas2 [Muribaculaceae bacterium]
MSKFMRLMVFFDLPVRTKEQRRVATSFRQQLVKDGYYMLQYSVYVRLCNGTDAAEKHLQRLLVTAPMSGSIRVLTVTEKQYASIKIIAGQKLSSEKSAQNFQISFF